MPGRTWCCARARVRRWAGRARAGVRGGRMSPTPGSRSTRTTTRWRRRRARRGCRRRTWRGRASPRRRSPRSGCCATGWRSRAGGMATPMPTRASDTVTVTVRAAPAVTAVALTSVPQNRTGIYRAGETIEVSVTFSAPVTVTGPPAMTPTIGLEVGTETRPAAYARNAGPAYAAVLLHGGIGGRGRGRRRGAGGRHPARGRDHCGVPTAWPCSATMRWRRTRRIWSTARHDGADRRGVRPHAPGARRAGGGGRRGERCCSRGHRDTCSPGSRWHAAARGPGHCGPEGRATSRT